MRYTVHVKPNSRKGPLVELQPDGSLVVYVRELAADSKANIAAVRLLASHFGVPKTRISIVSGHTSRIKRIEVIAWHKSVLVL